MTRQAIAGGVGRLATHGSAVAALLCMWLVGVVGVGAVLVLLDRLDSRREAQLVLADIETLVEGSPGIPLQADPSLGTAPAARARLDTDRIRFARLAHDLRDLDPDERVFRIETIGRRYYAALNDSLALVAAGAQERAGRRVVGLGRNQGLLAELRAVLAVQDADVTAEARSAKELAQVGTWLAVALVLLAFSFALFRATSSRRRAELLAITNEALLRQSRAEEQRYRDLFENANEPIATVDLDWKLTDVNAAFVDALGLPREELLGTSMLDYLTEEGQALSALHRDRKLAGVERATTYEQIFVRPDGHEVVFEVSTRLIEEDGDPVGVQGMCRDITARKEAEERLLEMAELNRYQAHHDALTGLPNRLAFHDEIERGIAAGRRKGPFALVLIDLDRFKQINDSLGHRAGDILLQNLAAKLAEAVPARSMLARLGGDEFGILLPGFSDVSAGWADALERIKAVFDEPHLVDGVPVALEASIGVAVHPTHGRSVDELLRRAEVAMYVAKDTGRGHAVYSAGEDSNDAGRLALLGELRRAISERELVLHYQPIVDATTNTTAKVEALLRWNHPEHGLILPAGFLPLAESTGLIRHLTRFVLDETAAQCMRWDADGRDIGVSINLSTRNLTEWDLVDDIAATLARWDVDPGRVTLEITESAVMCDPEGTKRVLDQLAGHGVRLAIDDFGAGFTSLSHLAQLPLHEIKLDRSFVVDLLTNDGDRAIVRSLLTLAHDLGLKVVAEGVESWDVLDELRDLGCDLVQGYLFARALPAAELSRWLASEDSAHSDRAA
jgi:diguanylate cyclase (GGDEF)-like protein/PAS domain S-box-containing protein